MQAPTGHAFQWLMAYTVGSTVMARGTQLEQEVLIEAISRMRMLKQSGPFLAPRNDAVFTRGSGRFGYGGGREGWGVIG